MEVENRDSARKVCVAIGKGGKATQKAAPQLYTSSSRSIDVRTGESRPRPGDSDTLEALEAIETLLGFCKSVRFGPKRAVPDDGTGESTGDGDEDGVKAASSGVAANICANVTGVN